MSRPAAEEFRATRAPFLFDRAAATLERILHTEAASGGVLLLAALAALLWANSSWASSYGELWHSVIALKLGTWEFSQSLHFWINDGLMTIFFLVVGMEVRREMHEGALSSWREAALPAMAAVGGVIVPALLFLAFNRESPESQGWAIPTATDIAFAAGVLALLGKGIPRNVRAILLALAVIDDVIAVLIIAMFYSNGLSLAGLLIAGLGVLLVLGFQRAGIGSAWFYILPGFVVWAGLLQSGAHPTLAGIVLGLLTPVRSIWRRAPPEQVISRIARDLSGREIDRIRDAPELSAPLRELGAATREILSPVSRVQLALHPWVAYGVMPLFALANAGLAIDPAVSVRSAEFSVAVGVAFALALGKPLGVIGMIWGLTRLGWCRLPAGVTWPGVVLVGLLTGIGFTMSVFIATLAFTDDALVGTAKLGVLAGSVLAAVLGLVWGLLYRSGLKSGSVRHVS